MATAPALPKGYIKPEDIDASKIGKPIGADAVPGYISPDEIDASQLGEPIKPRGALGEIWSQLKAGGAVDLPKMLGEAGQRLGTKGSKLLGTKDSTLYALGKSLREAAEKRGENPEYQPEPYAHGAVVNALAGGARTIAPSLGALLPAAAATVAANVVAPEAAIPAEIAFLLGGAAGVAPFGLSQAQEDYESLVKQGVKPEVANRAANISGLIESGGELVGERLLGGLGGIAKPLFRGAEKTAAGALERSTSGALAKPFLKELAGTAAGETATEFGQNIGEAAVRQAAGSKEDETPFQQGLDVIAPTLGMTALLAPFGLAGHGLKSLRIQRNTATLVNPDAHPMQRLVAGGNIARAIHEVDPEAAQNFVDNISSSISSGEPIQIGPHLLKPQGALSKAREALTYQPQPIPQPAPPAAAPAALPAPGQASTSGFVVSPEGDIRGRTPGERLTGEALAREREATLSGDATHFRQRPTTPPLEGTVEEPAAAAQQFKLGNLRVVSSAPAVEPARPAIGAPVHEVTPEGVARRPGERAPATDERQAVSEGDLRSKGATVAPEAPAALPSPPATAVTPQGRAVPRATGVRTGGVSETVRPAGVGRTDTGATGQEATAKLVRAAAPHFETREMDGGRVAVIGPQADVQAALKGIHTTYNQRIGGVIVPAAKADAARARVATIRPATVEQVHKAADKAGVPWNDVPAFMQWTQQITGKRKLDEMTPIELGHVVSRISEAPKPTQAEKANGTGTLRLDQKVLQGEGRQRQGEQANRGSDVQQDAAQVQEARQDEAGGGQELRRVAGEKTTPVAGAKPAPGVSSVPDDGLRALRATVAADRKKQGKPAPPPDAYKPEQAPAKLKPLVDSLSKAFGKKVQFFRANKDHDFFDGLVTNADPHTVYVNVNAKRPHMRVMFHETFHALRRTDPASYNRLVLEASRFLKNHKEYAAASNIEASRKPTSPYVIEEMFADAFAEHATNEKFWSDLSSQVPKSLMQKFVDMIRRAIARVRPVLQDRVNMRDYLSDYDKVGQHLQRFVREHKEGGAQADLLGSGAFSYSALRKANLKEFGLDKKESNSIRKVGIAISKWMRSKYGSIDRSKDRSTAASDVIAKRMANDYIYEMSGGREAKSASGWYTKKWQAAMDIAQKVFPQLKDKTQRDLFSIITGLTSNNTEVMPNSEHALEVYDNYTLNGEIKATRTTGKGGAEIRDALDDLNDLVQKYGEKRVVSMMQEMKTVAAWRKEGISIKEYPARMEVPQAMVFGPKVGAYVMALLGHPNYLVMDRWWNRTFNRYRGDMLPDATEGQLQSVRDKLRKPNLTKAQVIAQSHAIVRESEAKARALRKAGKSTKAAFSPLSRAAKVVLENYVTGLQDLPMNTSDREFQLRTTERAVAILRDKGIDTNVSEVQAVLWYGEASLFNALGNEPSRELKVSYEEAFRDALDRRVGRGSGSIRAKSEPRGSAQGARSAAEGSFSRNEEPAVGQSAGQREGEVPAATRAERVSRRPEFRGGPQRLAESYRANLGTDPVGRSFDESITVPGFGRVRFHSLKSIQDAAASYMSKAGLAYSPPKVYAEVDVPRAERIAKAYADMKHDPRNPDVLKAYDKMIEETLAQYQAALDTGLTVDFIDYARDGDPYEDTGPRGAMIDAVMNNHMHVFSTRDGFGTDAAFDPSDNPLLRETPFKISGRVALANDIFRVVHDFFGHVKDGNGFRARGEEHAWRSHAAMYSPLARRAMTSETRGQNSWLNYGPHGEKNRTAKTADTVFADQKSGLMPEWVSTDGALDGSFSRNAEPADRYAAENRRFREKNKPLWKRAVDQLSRAFAPGGLLPKEVFAEHLQAESSKGAEDLQTEFAVADLNRAVKTWKGVTFDKLSDVDRAKLQTGLAGNLDASLPPNVKTALLAMRAHIDAMSTEYAHILQDQIVELQNDDQNAAAMAKAQLLSTIVSNLGHYVNRSYRAFDDANWFKKIPTATLNAARDYLIQRGQQEGLSTAEAKLAAERVIHDVVKRDTSYDSIEGFIRQSKLGAKDLSILRHRKDIAPEIRALLGEYDDVRINYSKSAAKMARLIWNQRFLDRVREHGLGVFLFHEGEHPPEATATIARENNDTLAPLNGLRTFPEVDRAFKEALSSPNITQFYRTVIQMNGAIKYGKTVLSPTTAARNFMSSFFIAAANGHMNMAHMAKSIGVLKSFFNRSGDQAARDYMLKMKKLGVIYDSAYANEMIRLVKDSKIEDLLADKKATPFRWLRTMNEYAQKFYQYGDDFWKIIGFENEKADLVKAGFTPERAEEEAAARVRNTYPTYSLVGKAPQWLARFPAVGSFVAFPAEVIRTSLNMLRYVASDFKNPQLRPLAIRRAVGLAFASSFTWALQAITRGMFGVDDDEDEAVRQMSPPWSQNSNLFYAGRDERGNIQYYDASFLDPYNWWKRPLVSLLRNQPIDDAAISGLGEMLKPFLGQDIAAGVILDIYKNKRSDTGSEVFNQFATTGEQSVEIAKYLSNLLPGFALQTARTVKAAEGLRRPGGQPYDLGDEMMAWMGFRRTTLDPRSALYYRSAEFEDARKAVTATLSRVLRSPNPVDQSDIESAYAEAAAQQQDAYKKIALIADAAMKNGLSRAQVIQQLKASGVAARDIGFIVANRQPPLLVKPEQIRDAVQKARLTYGDATAQEIGGRYLKVNQFARQSGFGLNS